MSFALLFVCLLVFTSLSVSNVEKIIFIGPEALAMPNDASIDNLYLIALSPEHSTARTRLNATFPDETKPKGTESWMLLEGLTPGARYEVRVCWLATQPTEFTLHTHTLTAAFERSTLLSSLTSFAYARQAALSQPEIERLGSRRLKLGSKDAVTDSSMLFLQIFAAADYFSLDTALMENVPPVLVDVILDPYLLNVFPKSLLPTAVYITILAVIAWFLAGYIWKGLVNIAKHGVAESEKKKS